MEGIWRDRAIDPDHLLNDQFSFETAGDFGRLDPGRQETAERPLDHALDRSFKEVEKFELARFTLMTHVCMLPFDGRSPV